MQTVIELFIPKTFLISQDPASSFPTCGSYLKAVALFTELPDQLIKELAAKISFLCLCPKAIRMDVKIESSWKEILKPEFNKPYFQQIALHLKTEKSQNKIIYPPGKLIFNAFDTTPIDKVKVVILGQDPYHGQGQAHGLCFSVPNGVPQPPSLINIFKELHDDIGIPIPKHGNLTHWAEQGVFLLNASLTVRAAEPMSHSKIGWAEFTDNVIRKISEEKDHVVFMLWGKFAQEKRPLIDESKHLILRAAHPSPLSANAGFFGCRHFSKANEYLMSHGIDPIDWKL